VPAASPAVLARLREQLEFYFSDANYRKDKFLRAKAAENSDGFVPLAVIATFQRVRAATAHVQHLREALEGSAALEVSADGATIVPGEVMSNRTNEIPSCFLVLSVRTRQKIQSA
jgi:hypothetical protein